MPSSRNIIPYFNPRTREGCDIGFDIDLANAIGISIHAPVKGATIACRKSDIGQVNFNPRTREGCDSGKG